METCVTEPPAHYEAPREGEDDLTLVHAKKRGNIAAFDKIVVLLKKRNVKKVLMIANYLKAGLICLCALGMSNSSFAQTSSIPLKNIVLVHGAWADGSGWKGVYDILIRDGFNVSIVQEPETSFNRLRKN
jgi:hypothetical protein